MEARREVKTRVDHDRTKKFPNSLHRAGGHGGRKQDTSDRAAGTATSLDSHHIEKNSNGHYTPCAPRNAPLVWYITYLVAA